MDTGVSNPEAETNSESKQGGAVGLLTVATGVVLQFVGVFWIPPLEATPPGEKTKNSSSGSQKKEEADTWIKHPQVYLSGKKICYDQT